MFFKKIAFKIITIILILFLTGCHQTEKSKNLSEIALQIKTVFSDKNPHFFQNLMPGTKYETGIYRFQAKESEPAVLILGGTHGDEPAGFEAAYRLLDYFLKNPPVKGTVFIIPEANKIAVMQGERRIPAPESVEIEAGNLNRCYPGRPNGLPMQRLAFEITGFMANQHVKMLIDLHESSYFYGEIQSEDGESTGLGQSIICTPNVTGIRFGHAVRDKINQIIPIGNKQFTLKSGPVKNSAAWFAGENLMLPGFTIETCKKLSLEERIQFHLEISLSLINELYALRIKK
jgi:hypothetical protein